SRIPMLSENSSLSPLEESEKIVISRYLKKNHFNKSKTKRELKITINTLNAKIKRYGIGEAHHL
ncbi:MAG: helix-turn-helix domain-containing protein, partial [Spirochaetia bacterium]|nr:helix-turn-helix domain-containing protein [Spirochaetia bacterium]